MSKAEAITKAQERRITRKVFKDYRKICRRNNTMPMYYTAVLKYACNEMGKTLKK